ncbi:MAG TPA: PAS domain S-box protein [Prolixibacteraceae bacterium]|nr:PAS domain S-box protein [Prolixibacteraceae bacterium]
MGLFKSNFPALQKTLFVLIAFLGVTYIYYTWRSTEEDKFDQTRLIARSFVASLPIDNLKVLEALPGDIDKPQYQVIKNALKELISVNKKARFAYIFVKRKGKIFFIADSEPEESKDYSPPGQEYAETDLSFEQLYKDGTEYTKVHATDRWGTWTSVLVPVKDKVTGKTIAVFGIDFNAKSWFNSIFIEVTESSVLILLLLATLVLLYLINTKNKILKGHITKLLQAENELKQQKEEFEMIFNLVPAQIWYKDTHNSFIRVNRQVCNDIGLTENEITGHAAEEIFPSFAQKYFDDDLEVFNSGRPKLDIIEQINTCAGKLKWVHTDKFPVFGIDGELVGLVAFTQDITLRKMTEDALLKSETQLRTLLQTIPDLIWLKDNNGVYLQCNTMFERFFGARETDIMGKTDYDFIDKDLADFFRDHDRKAMAAGKPTANEEWITFADDGHRAYLETIKTPMYESDGKLIGILGIGRDFTERKMAEDALSSSEVRLHTLLQTIPDLIFIKDTRGVYLGCNSMFERYFGAIEADIIGKTDYDFVDKELADSFCENDHKAMEAGRPTRNAEWITFADDGHSAYLDTIKAPLYDSLGTLIGVMGIGRDISEHKKAEDALKASEEKYRTIFENVQDVFYQINLSGIINEISPSIKNFTGLSREEIIGTSVYNLYNNPEDRAFFLDAIMKNGKIRDYEIEFKTKTGKIKSISVNASIIFDTEGKPSHIDGALRDVTDQKRAEDEIAMLAYSLKSVNECVSIMDMDDKIIFVNESFLKTYGYDKNELIGKNISIVISQYANQEKVKKNLYAMFQREWQGELFNKRKDGSEFPIHLSTTVIKDKNGKSLGLIGVAKDITEYKKAEKELIEAKNKAEESDRLKSAFLANMSHEIRTPMNGILGFAGLLKEPMLSGEEQLEYIDIIEQSGNRMLNIINDIVSISKVESGQMEVSIKETNINEQIEYIYTFFRPEAEKKGIQLRFKNSLPSKMSIIKTDREKIYAILTNLVKNALKFTQTGIIEFGFSPKTKGESSELEFYVKDTGIGINPEHQKFIFERFRQIDDSLKRNYEGAGLGLAISRAYVEMLGGKIWVESEQGIGSTFYFTIPYSLEYLSDNNTPNTKLADSAKSQVDPEVPRFKILIVEDDETNLKLITATVKKFCNKILKAKTGIEAVEACHNNPDIDLILMDIKMPEMDGYEATRQIRQFNTEVFIIAQTAFALTGDREKALAAGCNDYISKPYGKSLLMSLMEKHFKNNTIN